MAIVKIKRTIVEWAEVEVTGPFCESDSERARLEIFDAALEMMETDEIEHWNEETPMHVKLEIVKSD